MPRSIPKRLMALGRAFVTQNPVNDQPPYSQLTSLELDDFGINSGNYGSLTHASSVNDLNTARQKLVARLNNAGSAMSWAKATDGFQVTVVMLGTARTTLWAVKPLPVAVSHIVTKVPDKALTRIANKGNKIERMYAAIDWNKVNKEEKKLLETDRDVMAQMGQLQADMTRIQNAQLSKSLKLLEKKQPGNRLL